MILLKNREPKTLIVNSVFTSSYIKRTDTYYRLLKEEFDRLTTGLKKPFRVRLTFYRTHEERWDFINLAQVVQDQMKKHGWVKDDSVQYLLCYPPTHEPFYKVDHINPGVLITIL